MENNSSDPRLFTLATALLESGAGNGSYFGRGTAKRSPAQAIRRTNPQCLFIADDSRTHLGNKPMKVAPSKDLADHLGEGTGDEVSVAFRRSMILDLPGT
jgi:hypothetical protein